MNNTMDRGFVFPLVPMKSRGSQSNRWKRLFWASAALLVVATAEAAPDLFIKDCPADAGTEPNAACASYYLSEDIWVRQTPIAGYQLAPFGADPAWLSAVVPLHQNPEYRDPKFSRPNFVYVRVRNRGSTASAGTERLRVYWAKASTGLNWPGQWVDYTANHCGPNKLYGIEITKPRKNAATASLSERTDYVNAINAIDTSAFKWVMDNVTYWDKQDQVHQLAPEHGSPAFLPWHREMMSRYENLLREANPIVTLLYWDWTTDPGNPPAPGTSLMTPAFMGTGNGVVGAPFAGLHAGGVCANARNGFTFPGGPNCNMHFNDWTYPPPNLYRNKPASAPGTASDAFVLGPALYQDFDDMEGNPHGSAHTYWSSGNLTSIPTATEDPIFFLLHANCDRLWATWQRQVGSSARLNAGTAYNAESGNVRINATMQPWDGSSGLAPWMPGAGSYTAAKLPKDSSVVFAPVYDTAPLRVPVLQAGESIVIEIPWYPPNPADFACFGADQGHVCLLARIETSTNAPFGMTFAEGANIGNNVRNNNNIAWKNITVQDSFPGLFFTGSVLLRNVIKAAVMPTRLQLRIPPEERNDPVLNHGGLFLDLGPELYDRWRQNGGAGQGIEAIGQGVVQVFGADAFLANIPLLPDEVQQIRLQLRLNPQYKHPDGRTYSIDVEQYGTPANPDELVGGQRFTYDFNKLTLVPKGSRWLYLDNNQYPGDAWRDFNYDDSRWLPGQAELGFGDGPVTTIDGGPPSARHITTWFRKKFDVPDPAIYRSLLLGLKVDDGVIVYLNGREIYRSGLPANSGPNSLSSITVSGVLEETCLIIPVTANALPLLKSGANILAAEVHQSARDSSDLSFDLELCANTLPAPLLSPPSIALTTPTLGSLNLLGNPILIIADAIDPGGAVASVSFFGDGQFLGTDTTAPYSVTWSNPSAGPHQITALALDSDGLGSAAHVQVQVLSNTPPMVTITIPAEGAVIEGTNHLVVKATATDNGVVQKVEFYLRHHHEFGFGQLVATRTTPPFTADLGVLPPDDWVVTAEATDNGGLTGLSAPVHVTVKSTAVRPLLTIVRMVDHLMLFWDPSTAILQSANSPLGPWTDMPNAANPLTLIPTGPSKFYRAYLP